MISCRLLIHTEKISQDRWRLNFYYLEHKILVFVKNHSSFSHLRCKLVIDSASHILGVFSLGELSRAFMGHFCWRGFCKLRLASHQRMSDHVNHYECCQLQRRPVYSHENTSLTGRMVIYFLVTLRCSARVSFIFPSYSAYFTPFCAKW